MDQLSGRVVAILLVEEKGKGHASTEYRYRQLDWLEASHREHGCEEDRKMPHLTQMGSCHLLALRRGYLVMIILNGIVPS